MSLHSWPAGRLDRSLDTPPALAWEALAQTRLPTCPKGLGSLWLSWTGDSRSSQSPQHPSSWREGCGGGGALSVPFRALPACSPPTLQPCLSFWASPRSGLTKMGAGCGMVAAGTKRAGHMLRAQRYTLLMDELPVLPAAL